MSGNKISLDTCYKRVITKHTVHERVQDGHGTSRDTSVGVNLLEDFRDLLVRVRKI